MPREERNPLPSNVPLDKDPRLTERSLDRPLLRVCQAVHLIQAAAADDPDSYITWHVHQLQQHAVSAGRMNEGDARIVGALSWRFIDQADP